MVDEVTSVEIMVSNQFMETFTFGRTDMESNSRVKCIKESDRNTRFFHLVSNVRRKANDIGSLNISGSWCFRPVQVKNGVFSFLNNYFKKGRQLRPAINGISVKQISDQNNLSLEAAFSSEEVWVALNNCDGNKASGPDGFNLNFIKNNWEIIKDDFINFLHEFSSNGAVVKDLNHMFLALIPKTKCPESLHDYRPISLIGSLYKVLAKVLANRLKLVMLVLFKWPLRKGDLLSPFFFNLVVEVLSNMLDKAKDLGMIKVSGLKVNFLESCLVKVGKKSPNDGEWAKSFCCSLASLPLLYLGLPLGGNPTREIFWRLIIAKVENRLAHWMRGFLSKGDRLVLIKVVLSSLPTYFMSFFRIPEGEAKRIEKQQREFFWNDSLMKKKMFVMDWVSLCKSKKQDGLGIGRMIDKWLSLIAKWLWRFGREYRFLWKNHGCGSDVYLTLLLLDISDMCVDKENVRVVKHKKWTPPMGNALFSNVDGSTRGCLGEAGIDGSLRDTTGQILLLFSSYLEVMNSCSAEVHTILKACQLVSSNISLLIRDISIITDLKYVVEWIKGEDFDHLPVAHLVYNIKNFIHDMAGLEIMFKLRASNSLADSLTKEGSTN
ncbi:hypothetical protein Ddye_012463 [Dipteronia dyeriana]|uniref:RNase H type-1 domain-containing protein n=1 Tax=Dipteronia dyeriana TaxID=168575 RepID=A0AAD9X4I4_9ROSI|nr:hypothetical protein Ddye_012463 [Dipteronia dyeriana]